MTRDLSKFEVAAADVFAGSMIPYLGPGVLTLGACNVPAAPADLAAAIEAKVRVPRRATGNMWAAAQYVESRKFRATLNAIVEEAFAPGVSGNPVHEWIATARPPLVVDTWYDDGLLNAYQARSQSWGWVQGVSRNGEWIDIFTRAYSADGTECKEGADPSWRSLIYKPHGLARKGSSFLMSDADYVEVLTEIDIQTPIPDEVKKRRQARGFLFLGCRFDDQLLRIFARQIMKRSRGPHYAVIPGELTRMEKRFLEQQGIERIDADLGFAVGILKQAA